MANPLQTTSPGSLAALRERLDRVDLEIHRLLRERFEIVAEIGASKGPGESIVRPAREAAVVENRLAVHTGPLPAETLAHFWRTMIAAACSVQRAYTVHVAGAVDAARYLYGPVPARLHPTAAGAAAALVPNPGDLAVVRLDDDGDARWWAGRGPVHAIGVARLSDGSRVAILGGAGISPGSGPVALAVRDNRLVEVRTADLADGDDVVGRVHPFPLTIPVAQ